MRTVALVIASLVCVTAGWPAYAADTTKQVYYFSAGWRVDQGVPQNVLQLGTLYPCPSGWCAEVEEFSGAKNTDREALAERHHMRAPYRKGGCVDGRLTVIRGDKSDYSAVSVQDLNETLVVETSRYKYVWKRDGSPQNGYALVSSQAKGSLGSYSQPAGYAYASDDATGVAFARHQFDGSYIGDIAHKNTMMGVSTDWQVSKSGLSLNRFTKEDSSNVYSLTVKGLDSVNKIYGKEMFVNHTILPPASANQRLRYFLHEYGHDFNTNGCFDDLGHNKMMLPVLRSGVVSAFVYVEYTPDKKDGVPMLSVGRYELPR